MESEIDIYWGPEKNGLAQVNNDTADLEDASTMEN
jgi:hypothetical protein